MTARIDHFQLTNTLEKIEKINARADKRGLSGRLDLTVSEVEVKSKDDMGFEVVEIMYDVEFTGEAPKHDGWVFLATLDWDPNAGLIVRTAPGVHSVDREGLREGACDHCNKDRMRRETFLVKHEETGEEKQIGRSCIKDFLGWETGISWPSTPQDDDEEKEFFGDSGDRDVSTETVLAYAWACTKAFGFVRSQDYHATPTVQLVRNALSPSRAKRDREFAEKMAPLAGEAKGKAAEVRAFILSDDFSGTSEYVLNLKAIAGAKHTSSRNFGILVSAPQAWARFNEQTLIRKARDEKPSEWIGTAPDKEAGVKGSRITFTGLVESIRYIDGFYGSTTLYQVRAEDSGVVVKWFASTNALGEDTGVRVTLRGTVKEHDEYKGIKSTVLTRCTLVEDNVTEPAPYVIDAAKKPRTPRKKAAPAPAPVPVVEEPQEAPETVQEDPQPEPQPVPDRTSEQTPSGLSSEGGSDSPARADDDPLAYYAGGAEALVAEVAESPEEAARFRANIERRSRWVRLGDDPAERVTVADTLDILASFQEGGGAWAADLVDGRAHVQAARWGDLVVIVGPDGDAPTV